MRCVFVLVLLAAVRRRWETSPIDASVDAFESDCGHPGDLGNELGIGKFCASL